MEGRTTKRAKEDAVTNIPQTDEGCPKQQKYIDIKIIKIFIQ